MDTAHLTRALASLTVGDLQAERARRKLRVFVEMAWPIVEPSAPFVGNWHIDALCAELEAITRGETKKLLANVPPGTSKSLIVSVLWPAWVWATSPGKRFLTASYEQGLATRDALNMRTLIESPWYQEHWPHVVLKTDQNQKTQYENTAGGWRFATSVGGRGTGLHPDIVVIDDPHNAKEAESDAEREAARHWFTNTITLRGASRGVAIVIIMQRLHEKDLSGLVLGSANAHEWRHLCFPMRAEPADALPVTKAYRPAVDPRQPGELLWPALFPESLVASLEVTLGSYAAAGQFQQRPAPAEGGILKTAWLQYYPPEHPPSGLETVVISVDPATKDKETNDYTAIQAWGVRGPNRYALRRVHGRFGTHETIQQISDLHRWAVEVYPSPTSVLVLVENAAAGPDVVRVLKHRIPGVVAWTAKGDKVQRAMAAQPSLEAGNVFVPGVRAASGTGYDPGLTPGWVQEMVTEWASFPFGAHDDDVDAFTQMMARMQRAATTIAPARIERFL